MIIFDKELQIYQLIIPAVCTGVLAVGLVLFFYIYKRIKDRLYLSMLLLNLIALVFVGSEIMILYLGSWLQEPFLGMQFHRIEHLAGACFIFSVPYYLAHILDISKSWHRINRYIWMGGLAVTLCITVIAFALPDLFISQEAHKQTWLVYAWDHGRGQEGVFYILRDFLLGSVIMYGIVSITADLYIHRKFQYLLLPLLGLFMAGYGAIDDSIYVYRSVAVGPLSTVFFSRVSIGFSVFVLMAMAGIIRLYMDKAVMVEKSYEDLENAYKILNHTELRFRQVVENMNEIFTIYDYRSRVFLYISPAFEHIFGQPAEPLYHDPELLFDYLHPDDQDVLQKMLLKENLKEGFDIEIRAVMADGSVHWLRDKTNVLKDKNGEVYRLVSIFEDITDRKVNEEALTYIAYHDVLTGLPNRVSFFERLHELIVQALREEPKKNKAVLFIDIDRFKDINDTFGHSFGDNLLKIVAEKLKENLRKSDYLFRLGSDEFTIILNGISDDLDAALVAKKLIEVFSDEIRIDGRGIYLGISVGISIYPRDGDDAESLVRHADMALRESKLDRGIHRFFDEEMNNRSLERINIESNIRRALNKKLFTLYYQPFVDLQGNIVGMEALIRWFDPVLGYVSPERFIPIAESTGLIFEIGDWTMERACSQLSVWQKNGFHDIRIAVNLSAQQFRDKHLVDKIKNLLQRYNVDGRNLELEITESSIMENPDETIRIITSLNAMGVQFSIDDFGIGYSSLSYLKRFKINHLKIDRSFIQDLIVDQNNTEITRAVIAMAHNLNIKVVAEGVETIEQLAFLRSLACDVLQGFLFSKPVSADEFEKLLEKKVLVV